MAEVLVVRSGAGPTGVRNDSDKEIVQLEAEIARKRERVAASLGELRQRVQRATNWRYWAGSHPIALIGAGLALGFVIGYRRRSRGSPE